jgi:hypothetical protein
LHQWPNDGPDFVGRTSLVIDIYGMSSENSSSTLLKMSFEKGGAMDVITDSALASKFPNESAKFYVPYASTTGRANPITNIRTLQNIVGKSSEHTMVHELAQHPANIWLPQVNGSQT